MTTFFDDPKLNTFIEEWVDEWETMVRTDLEFGMGLAESLDEETESLLSLIANRTRKAIHQEVSPSVSAQKLNENHVAIEEWTQRIIDNFEVNPLVWKAISAGMRTMYFAMVKMELHHVRDTRGVKWSGDRFIAIED